MKVYSLILLCSLYFSVSGEAADKKSPSSIESNTFLVFKQFNVGKKVKKDDLIIEYSNKEQQNRYKAGERIVFLERKSSNMYEGTLIRHDNTLKSSDEGTYYNSIATMNQANDIHKKDFIAFFRLPKTDLEFCKIVDTPDDEKMVPVVAKYKPSKAKIEAFELPYVSRVTTDDKTLVFVTYHYILENDNTRDYWETLIFEEKDSTLKYLSKVPAMLNFATCLKINGKWKFLVEKSEKYFAETFWAEMKDSKLAPYLTIHAWGD